MESGEMTLNDYLEALKRRKWSLLLPIFLVFIPAVIVALTLPSIYKSTSTILIEEQDIPANFVMATVTSYADQRIQAINQRIMSSARLMEIINRFDLYKNLRSKRTVEEIITMMKEDVKLEPISAEVVDRRTGRPTAAMIAFNLSYEGKESPYVVAQVANMLASLFLKENLKVRQRQTSETSRFIEEELGKVRNDLEATENKIADFKERHINELPELLNVNQQSYYDIERETDMLAERLRSLKEKESSLGVELASLLPHLEDKNEDEQRLDQLNLQLANLLSRVSEQYPDVIKLKAEIAQIEHKMAQTKKDADAPPDNPVYITLSSQLSGLQVEINSIQQQLKEFARKKALYRRRVEATPRVENEYKGLVSNRNNMQAKHDDLMRKLMEAKVAQGLEKEQKGERFTLIDPARVPEKPYKPNRLAIMLMGLILGVGAGIGMAALREYMDDAVRSADMLAQSTLLPVLAVVPQIFTRKDITRRRMKRLILVTAGVLIIAGAVIGFHFMIMDLDIFWIRLTRKISHIM